MGQGIGIVISERISVAAVEDNAITDRYESIRKI